MNEKYVLQLKKHAELKYGWLVYGAVCHVKAVAGKCTYVQSYY